MAGSCCTRVVRDSCARANPSPGPSGRLRPPRRTRCWAVHHRALGQCSKVGGLRRRHVRLPHRRLRGQPSSDHVRHSRHACGVYAGRFDRHGRQWRRPARPGRVRVVRRSALLLFERRVFRRGRREACPCIGDGKLRSGRIRGSRWRRDAGVRRLRRSVREHVLLVRRLPVPAGDLLRTTRRGESMLWTRHDSRATFASNLPRRSTRRRRGCRSQAATTWVSISAVCCDLSSG